MLCPVPGAGGNDPAHSPGALAPGTDGAEVFHQAQLGGQLVVVGGNGPALEGVEELGGVKAKHLAAAEVPDHPAFMGAAKSMCSIIDYLQLMESDSKGESRQQEISKISRSLKILAKELECPVIALSQLSRAPEQRSDHRPILSDLRESGAIEQDADLVMFLYRDEYYHEDSDQKNIAEVIIAKHRHGETGMVPLTWLGQFQLFHNVAHMRE